MSLPDAIALIESGRVEESLRPLEDLRGATPDDLSVLYVRAHALERLERWAQAWEAWREIEQLVHPSSPIADLDRLLDKVQTSASSAETPVDAAESELPTEEHVEWSDDEVVTETWARILAGQGAFAEAARVYATLAKRNPDAAERFAMLANEMSLNAEQS